MRWFHKCVVIGTAAAGLSGMVAHGQAQSQTSAEPWRLSLRVGGEFTDNREGSATNRQSNLDGVVEPSVDFLHEDADRTSVRAILTPVLKWHSNPRTAAEGAAQRDTELFGTIGLEFMHRLTPTVTINAGDQVTYNDNPQMMEAEATIRRSESYVLNAAHAGVDAALTTEAGLGVTTECVTTRYQNGGVADEADSDRISGKASPRYSLGSGWTILGVVGVSKFQEWKTERNRGSDTMTYDAGFEKSISPDYVGKIIGGYQSIQYKNDELESSSTMNGNAQLLLRATAPTRFRLSAAYGYTPPSDSAYSAQKATTLTGSIDHDVLSDRLTVSLEGQYRGGEYESEGEAAPGGSEIMTRITVHGTYYLTTKCSFAGGYSFENWESDLRESFNRNMADVSARIAW